MSQEVAEALEPKQPLQLRCEVARYHVRHNGGLEWIGTGAEVVSMVQDVLIEFVYAGDSHRDTEVEGDTFRLFLDEDDMRALLSAYAARHPKGLEVLGEAIASGSRTRRKLAKRLTKQAESSGFHFRSLMSGQQQYEDEALDEILADARELHEGIGGLAHGRVNQLWDLP